MAYVDEVKNHLIAYKELRFKNHCHGLWHNNPENVLKYAFIPEEADYNLILPYKDEFLKYEKA